MNQLLQEGRYRLEKQLSQDAHGTVYEAVDNKMNRSVLIKEIPVRLGKVVTASQQESIRLAFVTEAKRLANINHSSLLKVYDNFSEIGRQYLVLENVDGIDLEDLTKTNGVPFGYAEAAGWADQILDGLIYIHNMKPPVFHRAIKPKNIKLLAGGHVKLLAYSMTDANSQLDTSSNADDTQSPSLHYAPIEQIWESLDTASQKVITNSYDEKSEALLKQPADSRSDVFGMAATLYHLVTAKTPIDALERSIYMLEGKDDPLLPPNEVNPDVPVEVSNVIMRGLEIKREDRFESASMMRQVLKTSLVLVKEREAEEAKQPAVTAAPVPELETFAKPEPVPAVEPAVAFNGNGVADVSVANVSSIGNIPALHLAAEPPTLTASAPSGEEESEIVRQLREAEAKRKLAEERAAEAERLLRERDMALSPLTKPEQKERPEPDTYVPRPDEIAAREEALQTAPVEPAPEIQPDEYVPAFSQPEPEKEDIFAAARKPEPADVPPVANAGSDDLLPELGVSYAEANPLEELSAPISLEHVIDEEPAKDDIFANAFAPESEQLIHDSTSFAPAFASQEKRGSSFGLPMIAGAAAVLLVAVAVGWYFISSGNSAPVESVPPPVASQPENAVQEQQPQTQPETETVVSTDSEVPASNDTAATITIEEPSENAQPTRTDPRSQPSRPAKTRPVRADTPGTQTAVELPPAPKKQTAKKKLTVDDLLRDN